MAAPGAAGSIGLDYPGRRRPSDLGQRERALQRTGAPESGRHAGRGQPGDECGVFGDGASPVEHVSQPPPVTWDQRLRVEAEAGKEIGRAHV